LFISFNNNNNNLLQALPLCIDLLHHGESNIIIESINRVKSGGG
jgi:hypothetical protein